jgi:fumarate reductase flavoprotein subunit
MQSSARARADYDVIVVGSGVAGLAAAVEARQLGASVLVAESEGAIGGSSVLSGGIVLAAGTSIQRTAGITDSPEALWHEYMLFNQYRVEPALARALAFGSGPAIEWLVELGVRFHAQLIFAADEPVPRSHVPRRAGRGIVDALHRRLQELGGVDIALGRRIDRLLTNGGEVVGVAVNEDEVTAGAVVMATGGFGASPRLWKEYLPSFNVHGGSAHYIGARSARGDIFRLAAQVGADIVGYDRALALATPGFTLGLEVYFPGWLLMVDRSGARRVDESTSYAVMEIAQKQAGPLFAILDHETKTQAQPKRGGRYKQQIPGLDEAQIDSNWTEPVIDEMVHKGRIKQARSVEDLALALGVDAGGLQAAVAEYNRSVAAGEDSQYFKDQKFLRAVATPPFYGCELRLDTLCLTSTGIRVDARGRVLDVAGSPIAGLYAAGECTGGVLGDVYMGSGNSMANCLVFGRAAGQAAAAWWLARPNVQAVEGVSR